MKKYERLDLKNKWVGGYLNNSLEALLEDKELKILEIIGKIKEAIAKGELELKDKKKDKILQELDKLDKDYFNLFLSKYNELNKKYIELKSEIGKIDLIKELAQLKEMGVVLSVDDFGTGYSSLSYLQRLPVDELKIDQSFIAQLERSEPGRAITSSIIFLGHRLGLKTLAEGVETQKQLEFLKAYQCDAYQGHLHSRAIPKQSIEELFRAAAASLT